jgi:hypothetical protein
VPDAGAAAHHRETMREMEHARQLLLDELLADFPFVGPPERTQAVATLLEQIVWADRSSPAA